MDQTSDNNPVPLYRVDQLVGTPDYVMDAPVLDETIRTKYASSGFADPSRKEFPIFNKAATWASYAYLVGAGRQDSTLAGVIKKAAANFGICADLEKIDAAFATEKSASAEVEFALPAGSIPGHEDVAVYPIKSAFDVEESARQLLNDKRRIPVDLFYQAATALTKAASRTGVVLPDVISAAGELRYPDFDFADMVADQRRFVVKSAEAQELYKEVVKSARAAGAIDVQDWINSWLELDRTYQVKYAKGIVDPYAAFYSGPSVDAVEKAASETVFVAGASVPSSVIAKLSEETLREHFSKAAADSLVAWTKQAGTDAVAATATVAGFSLESQRQILALALLVA